MLTIAFPQILHPSSSPSLQVAPLSCIRQCLVMKTCSFQQQSHRPVELTLTTCLDSQTCPLQTPGQTLSINRPVVCVVKILIFALGVNYSLQSRNCNKASVTDKEKNFQPVCCFLCLAAKRQELFLAVGMTSSLKEIKHYLFVLDQAAPTCLASKHLIVELQTSLKNNTSFYRYGSQGT